MFGERGKPYARGGRLRGCALGRRNADEAQAIPMAPGESLDRECRR